MKISGFAAVIIFTAGLLSSVAEAKLELPKPVHPDTLPTLTNIWTLPASLAPRVKNAYSPRMTLRGTVLYVYDHHGRRLVAVQATNGKVKWHQPVPSRSSFAFSFTPLVTDNRVFVASDGYLFSYNAIDGKVKWRLETKGLGVNGLARSKHRLYLPWIRVSKGKIMPGVNLWAVDSRRGRVEWSKKFPGRMAYVVGDPDGVYYAGNTGIVFGLSPDRGEYLWKARVKGEILSPPLLKGKKLYISTLLKKAGWQGTVIYALDLKKGKIEWQTKIPSTKVSSFLAENHLAVIQEKGTFIVYDDNGKKSWDLNLEFSDAPRSLHGVSIGNRAYVFSSHRDGNGYISLIDLEHKKILARANAFDGNVRSIIPAAKLLFLDGEDGTIYVYRMDQSQRPLRASVPAEEFAKEILARVSQTKAPVMDLAPKLAGLGPKALPSIETALNDANPYVVALAARAIGLLRNRQSTKALLGAIKALEKSADNGGGKNDPLMEIIDALAILKDGRAIKALQEIMTDETQGHFRRRAAYVALGSIGSPAALAPIWAFRAANQATTTKWHPQANMASTAYKVEDDIMPSQVVPEEVKRRTTFFVQNKSGETYAAALSPYLGGYNDIWFGKSDANGKLMTPEFTGLTKPEVLPNRRIRIEKLKVSSKGAVTLKIKMKGKKSWISAKPVTFQLKELQTDSDKDGLSNIVEKRLHLCIRNPDSDGDGLIDSEDLNPLASSKTKLTEKQRLYREAFFTFYAFMNRRGIVVVDPGNAPSFEVYGRRDPVISLRRSTIERFRNQVGLHGVDIVSFGGPYPEGGGSGDALEKIVWNSKHTEATIGLDIFRAVDNAVAYNLTLKKFGKHWVVKRMSRVWTTN